MSFAVVFISLVRYLKHFLLLVYLILSETDKKQPQLSVTTRTFKVLFICMVIEEEKITH